MLNISLIRLRTQILYYDIVTSTSRYIYTLFKALTGKATIKIEKGSILQVPLTNEQMSMFLKYYPAPVWFEGMTETEMAYRTGASDVVQRLHRMHQGGLHVSL